ncbi:MAG: His-Xaa-Ser system radical SAM maturase HxsB [Candidatus Omnitrophota bacterium]|nr:His-Xaa-Ser system radical SAM maturase HxsB [Candidatus Omnitrophota bacterium]
MMDFGKIKIDWPKVGFFRFKEIKANRHLLTNDVGEYVILSDKEFKGFLEGKLKSTDPVFKVLREQGLIRNQMDFPELISGYRKKNMFLFQGPSLHIIVLTLRCDHKCVYCQASSRGESERGFDLDTATAKKIVDIIFASPAKSLAIEFQGGEPLLNWPVLKFIIDYALEKNKTENKSLELRLVSNFSMMDKEKLAFLVKNRVTLCTSLDGPEHVHNKNRAWIRGNSHKHTIKWLGEAQKVYKSKFKNRSRPGAIVTVSRYSLKYPEKIAAEYIKHGMEAIFVRPLTPLGMAKKVWSKIGYTPQEYLKFYKTALNYIISYALKHPKSRVHENTAKILLAKILTEYDPNFLELRSPCGAGTGQVLYNYDGKVYTCDEARMVGEDIFCIGNVKDGSYKDIVAHPTVRILSMASCLENTACDLCVYKPYCGVCPIYNWAEYGNLFSQASNNARCIIFGGILDFLFAKLEDKKVRKLFEKWAAFAVPEPQG